MNFEEHQYTSMRQFCGATKRKDARHLIRARIRGQVTSRDGEELEGLLAEKSQVLRECD